mmetsp:Transcript_143032/g.398538  ORF Transcript_143032/g.398538 Transcript_143032/m.398538 type:complete len:427 (+) Transcript_143032:560-1840(+)
MVCSDFASSTPTATTRGSPILGVRAAASAGRPSSAASGGCSASTGIQPRRPLDWTRNQPDSFLPVAHTASPTPGCSTGRRSALAAAPAGARSTTAACIGESELPGAQPCPRGEATKLQACCPPATHTGSPLRTETCGCDEFWLAWKSLVTKAAVAVTATPSTVKRKASEGTQPSFPRTKTKDHLPEVVVFFSHTTSPAVTGSCGWCPLPSDVPWRSLMPAAGLPCAKLLVGTQPSLPRFLTYDHPESCFWKTVTTSSFIIDTCPWVITPMGLESDVAQATVANSWHWMPPCEQHQSFWGSVHALLSMEQSKSPLAKPMMLAFAGPQAAAAPAAGPRPPWLARRATARPAAAISSTAGAARAMALCFGAGAAATVESSDSIASASSASSPASGPRAAQGPARHISQRAAGNAEKGRGSMGKIGPGGP